MSTASDKDVIVRALAAVLLAAQLAVLFWFVRGGLARYRGFQRLVDSGSRRARFRTWIVKSWLAFGLPSLVGLTLLGRWATPAAMPGEFAPAAALLPEFGPADVRPIATGALIGLTIGTVLIVLVSRWRRSARPFGQIGDIGALLPRTRAELLPAAWISVTAGVTEELAFRLYLPLLVTLVSGSGPAGFAIAALLFGAMHRYQGWAGVVATTLVGLLLTGVYLASGRLWLAMLVHAVIDLNGLVLRPALTGAWTRRNTDSLPSPRT